MKKILILSLLTFAFSISVFGQKVSSGTIEGKLMYPSEYIPPEMIVCVQKTDANLTVCSNGENKDYKFTLDHEKATYSVKLPIGKYHVFAAFPFGKAPVKTYEGYKAYYNEFVTCGIRVECKSHENIEVFVRPNATVKNITPGDWYKD